MWALCRSDPLGRRDARALRVHLPLHNNAAAEPVHAFVRARERRARRDLAAEQSGREAHSVRAVCRAFGVPPSLSLCMSVLGSRCTPSLCVRPVLRLPCRLLWSVLQLHVFLRYGLSRREAAW